MKIGKTDTRMFLVGGVDININSDGVVVRTHGYGLGDLWLRLRRLANGLGSMLRNLVRRDGRQ